MTATTSPASLPDNLPLFNDQSWSLGVVSGSRPVAVLCVQRRTQYRDLPGVECYDIDRDVRTFAGGMPVVAHPPCRSWSAFTWRRGARSSGRMSLPESYRLSLNGEEVAVVQRHSGQFGYFWYGAGKNTANRCVDLETAKAEARAHIESTLPNKGHQP